MIEARRLADDPTNGESVKPGAESIRDFTSLWPALWPAYGMFKGSTSIPEAHGGSRSIHLSGVKNGALAQIRDGFEGPKLVAETAG